MPLPFGLVSNDLYSHWAVSQRLDWIASSSFFHHSLVQFDRLGITCWSLPNCLCHPWLNFQPTSQVHLLSSQNVQSMPPSLRVPPKYTTLSPSLSLRSVTACSSLFQTHGSVGHFAVPHGFGLEETVLIAPYSYHVCCIDRSGRADFSATALSSSLLRPVVAPFCGYCMSLPRRPNQCSCSVNCTRLHQQRACFLV